MFYIPQAHYVPTNPNASVDTASHLAQLESAFDPAFDVYMQYLTDIYPYIFIFGCILLTIIFALICIRIESRYK